MDNPNLQRDLYDENLFVGREDILREILTWAQVPSHDRILSLTGSPGVGKTWLLEEAQRRLQTEYPNRLIFKVILSDLKTDADRKNWLRKAIEKVQEICGDTITLFDENKDFITSLQQFIREVCKGCELPFFPILVADGFDEATNRDDLAEKLFLAHFMDQGCFTILMAHREDISLKEYVNLKDREKTLPVSVFPTSEGAEQLTRRAHFIAPLLVDHLDVLRGSIPPYTWNHGQLNSLLLTRAADNHLNLPDLLAADDLRFCLENLVAPPLDDHEFQRLVNLCHLHGDMPDQLLKEWRERNHLEKQLNLNLKTPCVAKFFSAGIVLNAGGGYFQVADGVQELARAWKILENHRTTP